MNAGDAMFIAKANGASDKAIEATNKNYGAYAGGGIVDVTKINKQTAPEKRNVGQAVPKVTETKVEVKPKQQQPPKMTATEWNKKWSELKKGQTLVGLDGKTYTKK